MSTLRNPSVTADMLRQAGFTDVEVWRMMRATQPDALVVRRTSKPEAVDEDQHPDDVASERKAIADAHSIIDAFVEAHGDALIQLVLTYNDVGAQSRLAILRERFWTEVP